MLIKSHGKCSSINQIAIECITIGDNRGEQYAGIMVAVSYLLFKSVDREMGFVVEGLRKESNDPRCE